MTSRQLAKHTVLKPVVSQTSRLVQLGLERPRHPQQAHPPRGHRLTPTGVRASTSHQPSISLPISPRLHLPPNQHPLYHLTFRVTLHVKSRPQRLYHPHPLALRSAPHLASGRGPTLSQNKLVPSSAATQMLSIAQGIRGDG